MATGCPLPEKYDPGSGEDVPDTGEFGSKLSTDCALEDPWPVVGYESLESAYWWMIPNIIAWTTIQYELYYVAEEYGCPAISEVDGMLELAGDCAVEGIVEVRGRYAQIDDETVLEGFEAWYDGWYAAGEGTWVVDSTEEGTVMSGDSITTLEGIGGNDGTSAHVFDYECEGDGAGVEVCSYYGYVRVFESVGGASGDFCLSETFEMTSSCELEGTGISVLVGDHTLVARGDAGECDGCLSVKLDGTLMGTNCDDAP